MTCVYQAANALHVGGPILYIVEHNTHTTLLKKSRNYDYAIMRMMNNS